MAREIENMMRLVVLAQHRGDRVATAVATRRLLNVLAQSENVEMAIEATRVINHIRH